MSGPQAGVGLADLLPPGAAAWWGRPQARALALVDSAGQAALIVVVDAAEVPAGLPERASAALGVFTLVLPTGARFGAAAGALDAGVRAAGLEALADLRTAKFGYGEALRWGICALTDPAVAAHARRLPRAPSELEGRRADPALERFAEARNGAPRPPDVPWARALPDGRLRALVAVDADGLPIGAFATVGGVEALLKPAGGRLSPGALGLARDRAAERDHRGERARPLLLLAAAPLCDVALLPPALGPAELGRLRHQARGDEQLVELLADALADGLADALAAGADGARPELALAAAALPLRPAGAPLRDGALPAAPAFGDAVAGAHPRGRLRALRRLPAPDAAGEARALELAPFARLLCLPGEPTAELADRIAALPGPALPLLLGGPSGGHLGAFPSPREFDQQTDPGAHALWGRESGRWLLDALPALAGAGVPLGPPPPAAEPPTPPPSAPGAGPLRLRVERRAAPGGAGARLHVQVSGEGPPPAGEGIGLERVDPEGPRPLHLRGAPVDDLRQAFQVEAEGGGWVARWSCPFPRRLVGRRLRAKVGMRASPEVKL